MTNFDEEIQETISNQKPSQKEKTCVEVVKKFLDGYFKVLNLNYSFEAQDTPELITINIKGNNLGDVIGYRGSGIDALQYILAVIISKNFKHGKKVYLDIDNFKQKRKQNLEEFAKETANELLQSEKQEIKLEPMSAYERFVIHETLKSFNKLETHSEGEEPNRFLIISKK